VRARYGADATRLYYVCITTRDRIDRCTMARDLDGIRASMVFVVGRFLAHGFSGFEECDDPGDRSVALSDGNIGVP